MCKVLLKKDISKSNFELNYSRIQQLFGRANHSEPLYSLRFRHYFHFCGLLSGSNFEAIYLLKKVIFLADIGPNLSGRKKLFEAK